MDKRLIDSSISAISWLLDKENLNDTVTTSSISIRKNQTIPFYVVVKECHDNKKMY